MDTTFIEEKLLFVVKMYMYGVRRNNIYVLLGDLLSMYVVNRSSITACWTGGLNKHLLIDSNKMINYAEVHVYWIDKECDTILLALKLMNYLYFKNVFCCVVPVRNRPDSQAEYKWKQTENCTSELLNATVRLEPLHQACWCRCSQAAKLKSCHCSVSQFPSPHDYLQGHCCGKSSIIWDH